MNKRHLLRMTIAAIAALTPLFAADPEEKEVLRAEETFRQAKLKNDTVALTRFSRLATMA